MKGQLYVDLDGVLADFGKRAREIIGKSSYTKKELWKTLRPHIESGGFWDELEPMPDANILWVAVRNKEPIILTASGHIAPALTARLKEEWVRRHFGNVPVIVVRTAKDKIPYALGGNTLIDDRADTIKSWNAAGGIGILHTSAKKTVRELSKVLTEGTVAHFTKNIQIKIEVVAQTTKHADIRQDQRHITDEDISKTVYKAIDKIMQAFTDGDIREGEQFRIYDPSNDHLNLIAIFYMNDKGTPEKIRIVTAIRKRDFKPNNIKRTIKV